MLDSLDNNLKVGDALNIEDSSFAYLEQRLQLAHRPSRTCSRMEGFDIVLGKSRLMCGWKL